ncbi:MAG TPA: hypothetical protein VEX68_28830 [Bryobacteraceae bacterium]|nr:hypothetical protein [Bryobacteraceae bacterium]
MHSERIEHGRRAVEGNPRRLLPYRYSGKEDRYEAVLSAGQTIARMTGYLKDELAVSPLMEKTPGGRPPDRQPPEHKWTATETEILPVRLTLLATIWIAKSKWSPWSPLQFLGRRGSRVRNPAAPTIHSVARNGRSIQDR